MEVLRTGARLGVVAGLVATLFEGLHLLASDLQVHSAYPIALAVFNLSIWLTFGLLSGCFLSLCRTFGALARSGREQFHWCLVFLLPFALIYGIGGRVYSLLLPRNAVPIQAFDHHLSLLWAVLLVGILSLRFWRAAEERSSPRLNFFFEIFGLVLLIHFATNLELIVPLFGIEAKLASFAVYLLGVTGIGALVLVVFPGLAGRIEATFGKARSDRATAPLLAMVVALSLLGTHAPSRTRATRRLAELPLATLDMQRTREGPDMPVILIVLDTVRADRLSVYGTHGKTAHLKAFAREALVFDNARSVSSWTVPSHASLFTGLSPREHGVHTDLAGGTALQPSVPYLSDDLTTIAEIFQQNGYATAGIVANFGAAGPEYNFHQGFDLYDVRKGIGHTFRTFPYSSIFQNACYISGFFPRFVQSTRLGHDINDVAFAALARISQAPFFLFLNYMDAHAGYRPPTPYDGYFLDTDFPKLQRMKMLFQKSVTRSLSHADWTAFSSSQYDGALSYLDAELGRLFERLRAMELYDRSLIVITSDHGELFDEHGLSAHRTMLYEGAVKIPLLIKFPNSRRVGRETGLISSADVFATLLSIAGLPLPEGISGEAFGGELLVSELYEQKAGLGEHRALFRDRYKLMWYENKRRPELYDLRRDPTEQVDLASLEPEMARALEQDLRDWESSHQPRASLQRQRSEESQQELLQHMKVLGYLE